MSQQSEEEDLARVAEQTVTPPERATASENQTKSATVSPNRIRNGIEFFRVGDEDDCQCARCGSSCYFADCDNCGGEGEIEDDDWQCEGEYHRCDWCRGVGGWWRCDSSEAYCEANPALGRENQPVMGRKTGEYD